MSDSFSDRCLENWHRLPVEIRAHIPQADAWGLAADTREEKLARERRRRVRLFQLLASGKDIDAGNATVLKPVEILEKRKAFKDACAADPVFFVENLIWTKDPENKVRAGRKLPLLLFEYEKRQYFDVWLKGLENVEARTCIRKSRRMKLSIDRMAWSVWRFRHVPNTHSWVSSDKENKIDKFNDWNSLLGKWRFMWNEAVAFAPWYMPHLEPHSNHNKLMNIRFPEWRDRDKKPVDEEVWGNEMLGILPADPRSFAASDGFADEAAYIEDLQKLLFGAEDMTPDLCLGSTAPPDMYNLFWTRSDLPGVHTETVPWLRNPMNCENIRWEENAEWRGPHTKRWRSDPYQAKLDARPSQEIAREWDIDPMATAGARIWNNFKPERNCMPADPKHHAWDLYDRNYETIVWYDVGRGDPWSVIWLQVKDDIGFVDVVDYWMRDDVTVHWWIPMLLGWPLERMHLWMTKPEALSWRDVVPWPYDEEEREIISRWNSRRRDRGGHISWMYGDFFGSVRGQTDLYTVEERLHHYGLMASSAPAQWQMDSLLEHANEVLLRLRISGRLVGKRTQGGRWPSIDECLQMWRRGERKVTTGQTAKPLHDDYSHTGQAITFGAKWLPATVEGRIMEDRKRVVVPPATGFRQVGRSDQGWYT